MDTLRSPGNYLNIVKYNSTELHRMKPCDLLFSLYYMQLLKYEDNKNLFYKPQKNFIEFLLLVYSLKVISTYWYFKTIIIVSTA